MKKVPFTLKSLTALTLSNGNLLVNLSTILGRPFYFFMSPEGQIVPSEKVPTSKMWKSATKGKNPKVPFEVDDNQRKLALIASKKEIVNPKRKL